MCAMAMNSTNSLPLPPSTTPLKKRRTAPLSVDVDLLLQAATELSRRDAEAQTSTPATPLATATHMRSQSAPDAVRSNNSSSSSYQASQQRSRQRRKPLVILDMDALTYYPAVDCADDPQAIHVDRRLSSPTDAPGETRGTRRHRNRRRIGDVEEDGSDPDFLPNGAATGVVRSSGYLRRKRSGGLSTSSR